MRAGGPQLPIDANGKSDLRRGSGNQLQARLAAADQLEINLRQKLGVEQRAMLGPGRVVDSETPAQRTRGFVRRASSRSVREVLCDFFSNAWST